MCNSHKVDTLSRFLGKPFLVNDELDVLYETRGSLVDFMNMNVTLGIGNTNYYLTLGCSYKGRFLFTNKHHLRIDYWKATGLSTFAKSDTEESIL